MTTSSTAWQLVEHHFKETPVRSVIVQKTIDPQVAAQWAQNAMHQDPNSDKIYELVCPWNVHWNAPTHQ
jgi:hypothetical protein